MKKPKMNSGINALNLLKDDLTKVTKGANLSENEKDSNDTTDKNSEKKAISLEIPSSLLKAFIKGIENNKIPKVSRTSYFVNAIFKKMKEDGLI